VALADPKPRVSSRNVSMYPEQWAFVEQVARESGGLSVSAALRLIVTEWQQDKAIERPRPDGPLPGEEG
jgi:hypothetical protein